MKEEEDNKPVVAFMPTVFNLGETVPLIETAKKLEELGGKAVFICRDGGYSQIIKDYGFKYIELKVDIPENLRQSNQKKLSDYNFNQKKREDFVFEHFPKGSEELNMRIIEDEVELFKQMNVKLVVTGDRVISKISAKKANIPIMFIISGVGIPQYYISNYATFPDNYENFFTKLVPNVIKDHLANLYILKSKRNIKGYNRIALKNNISKLKYFYELHLGDYTLIADDRNFLDLKNSDGISAENFIGPIIGTDFKISNEKVINEKINKHLDKPGRSILVSMGSSATKGLILKIIDALNDTNYNVIVVYSKFKENEKLPKLNKNILFFKSVRSIKNINEKVDLVIIHGGRGTVYTAAYSGKPVIGYPMHVEQQYNLECLVRHQSAIRLSKNSFSKEKLLTSINEIFNNYKKYYLKAQKLKKKLKEPKGAENAARIIFENCCEN